MLSAALSNPKMSHPIQETLNSVLTHAKYWWTVAIIWELFLWRQSILGAEYAACRRLQTGSARAGARWAAARPPRGRPHPQPCDKKRWSFDLAKKRESFHSEEDSQLCRIRVQLCRAARIIYAPFDLVYMTALECDSIVAGCTDSAEGISQSLRCSVVPSVRSCFTHLSLCFF